MIELGWYFDTSDSRLTNPVGCVHQAVFVSMVTSLALVTATVTAIRLVTEGIHIFLVDALVRFGFLRLFGFNGVSI